MVQSAEGSAAGECYLSPGQTALAVSLWPTQDVSGCRCNTAGTSAAHAADVARRTRSHDRGTSDRADQSFSVTVLPRRSRRCRSVANAHRAEATRKCLAVETVAITNEVVRHRLPPAGLADLPGDPFAGWRYCDADPKEFVCDHVEE